MEIDNRLANLFIWLRVTIEAAETPFVKLAILILPVLAPVVPASITGYRLYTELGLPSYLCVVAGIVLELLGYVGAISLIRSIYNLVKNPDKENYWLPVLLNFLAYIFYVMAMYFINVQLGVLANDDPIIHKVFALLSFITIPTGILAAEHIYERGSEEKEDKLRAERRNERIERYRIKYQANTERTLPNTERTLPNKRRTHRTPNEHRTNKSEQIKQFVRSVRANEHRTPGVIEVANRLGFSKSYVSEIMRDMEEE